MMLLRKNNSAKRTFAKLGLVLASSILGLAMAEIGLRLFWHPELTSWQRSISTEVPIDPAIIAGVAGPARIVTNSMGIRGDEVSSDRSSEYRILTIGGSTTECLLNDQPNTWPALLQSRLGKVDGRKVWVGNVGHGGFDSRHHVLQMKYMLGQYNPDAVVILMGANDAGLLLGQGMSYDPHFVDDQEKMRNLAMRDFIEKPVALMSHWDPVRLKTLKNTRLVMMLKEAMNRLFAETALDRDGLRHKVEMYRELRERRGKAWLVINDMPPDLKPALESYAHNIGEIIRMAREHRVRLVFMTQPLLLQANMSREMVERVWAGWLGDPSLNVYWSPEVLAGVTDKLNSLMLEICRQEGIEYIDLAAKAPRSLDVFFDHCHFTDYGCSLVADEVVTGFRRTSAASQKTH
jgi:lysophospholipase L1-like esterase